MYPLIGGFQGERRRCTHPQRANLTSNSTATATAQARSMPEDWARFKRKCIEGFSRHFGVEFSKESLLEVRASSKVTVYGSEAEAKKMCKLRSGSLLDAEGRNIIELRVSGVRELIPSGGKDHSCVHVELVDGGSGVIKYVTGDHVGIFPENETSKVLPKS